MAEKEYMTVVGLNKVKERLLLLEKELAALRIYKNEEAINAGDSWHDNPTLYAVELKERGLINDVAQLKERISNAVVVKVLGGGEKVTFGTKVKIKYPDGISEEFQILGEADSDPAQNIISYKSPLGKALMGAKEGDKVGYKVGNEGVSLSITQILI